jgi:hypothetical protein
MRQQRADRWLHIGVVWVMRLQHLLRRRLLGLGLSLQCRDACWWCSTGSAMLGSGMLMGCESLHAAVACVCEQATRHAFGASARTLAPCACVLQLAAVHGTPS